MRFAKLFGYGCVAIGLTWSLSFAADPPKNTDDAAIQQSLRELDHAEWSVRERATQLLKLKRSGAAVVKLLAQRAATGSPEAAVRATEVLAAFYTDDDFPNVDELEAELESLVLAKGSVGEIARRAWEDRRIDRERRALVRIEELGGTILYPKDVRSELIEDHPDGLRDIDSIVITRRWKGGDDGLRYVRRLTVFAIERRIYRVKGAQVSDAAFEQLEQAGFQIEPRGARLGIVNRPLAPPDAEGCAVDSVKEGSPADKAGILSQDVILKFDEKSVTDFQDLIEVLKETEPGKTAILAIRRGGEVMNIPVVLDDW